MIAVITILGIIGLVFIKRGLILVTVEGFSMAPELLPKEQLLVCRYWPINLIYRGQFVLVRFPSNREGTGRNQASSRMYVKKVVALPGDTMISLKSKLHTQRSFVNLDEFNNDILEQYRTSFLKIPTHHFFVVGNHPLSNDSLVHGPLPFSAFEGVAILQLRRHRSNVSLIH